jgi:hypothetical protein
VDGRVTRGAGEEVFKSLKREILLSNQPEVVLYDKIVIRGTRPKLSADHGT